MAIVFNPRYTGWSANDGNWHHICVTWKSKYGYYKFVIDGVLRAYGYIKKGYTIPSVKSLVLGQRQHFLGGFYPSKKGENEGYGFQGSLTDVNIWDYVLQDSEIENQAKSCFSGEGNMYKWSNFFNNVKGDAKVFSPSQCKAGDQ